MRLIIYILTIIYFIVVSIPVFIIIFILTQLFYTLKKLTTCIKKQLTQSHITLK